MFKKTLFFVASSLFAMSSAHAGPGLYFGGGLGLDQIAATVDRNYVRSEFFDFGGGNSITVNEAANSNFRLHDQNLNGNIFAGYGFCLGQNMYVAGEVVGFLSNTKATDAQAYTGATISNFGGITVTSTITEGAHITTAIKGGVGVRVLPGYFVNDAVSVYGVLGLKRAKVNFQLSETENGDLIDLPLATNQTIWRNGFEYGLGMQTSLTQQLDVRAQLTQTRYQALTIDTNTSASGAGTIAGLGAFDYTANATHHLDIKPVNTVASIDLVWVMNG